MPHQPDYYATPNPYQRTETGQGPGQTAGALESEANDAAWEAKAGVHEGGSPPVFDLDKPAEEIWDAGTYGAANQENQASLRFQSDTASGPGAPVGGEVALSGEDATTHAASLTAEAFVKMGRQTPRHALVASKRRNGQSGATWSLSIDPEGRV